MQIDDITSVKMWRIAHCSQEYDFVFDVELYKDRPPLKLLYNVGDDPQLAARNFLQQNGVDERFLETVINFIRSHTGGRALALHATATTTVSDISTGLVIAADYTYLSLYLFNYQYAASWAELLPLWAWLCKASDASDVHSLFDTSQSVNHENILTFAQKLTPVLSIALFAVMRQTIHSLTIEL